MRPALLAVLCLLSAVRVAAAPLTAEEKAVFAPRVGVDLPPIDRRIEPPADTPVIDLDKPEPTPEFFKHTFENVDKDWLPREQAKWARGENAVTVQRRKIVKPDGTSEYEPEPDSHHYGIGTTDLVGNGILYGGGRVMTDRPHIYLIWYGEWGPYITPGMSNLRWELFGSKNHGWEAVDLIREFVLGWGRANPYSGGTLTTYADAIGRPVSPHALLLGETYVYADSRNPANAMSRNAATDAQLVASVIRSKNLPTNPNVLYVVLPSENLYEGNCVTTCAHHTTVEVNGVQVPFIVQGSPGECNIPRTRQEVVQYPLYVAAPQACGRYDFRWSWWEQNALQDDYNLYRHLRTPNHNRNVDMLVNVLSHELAETITDPLGGPGWNRYNPVTWWRPFQIGDLCRNEGFRLTPFPPATPSASPRSWMLQPLYTNQAGGYCGWGVDPSKWGSFRLSMSTSTPLWNPYHVLDSNTDTAFSSLGTDRTNSRSQIYAAAYVAGAPQPVGTVAFTGRITGTFEGRKLVVGWPQEFDLYTTDPANTVWQHQARWRVNPDRTGSASVTFVPRNTHGVLIIPRVLTPDAHGNYYLQLSELKVLP